MMVRHFPTRRIAAATTAFIAIAAVATAGAAPVPSTEASWVDGVYVNASLQADEYAGVNSAGAAGSNGTVQRLIESDNIGGVVSQVNNENEPYHADSGGQTFPSTGFLGLVSLTANARSCARVDSFRCPAEPANTPGVQAFAQSDFNSIEIETSEYLGAWLIKYTGGPSDPIRTTASCTPGETGVVGLEPGQEIEIRRGLTGLLPRSITVPTKSGGFDEATGYITNAWRYDTKVSYFAQTGVNYARSEVRLTVAARPLLSNEPTWTADLLLSHAECGLSSPVGGQIVPASVGARELAALAENGAAALDEAHALDADASMAAPTNETTTSAPPDPSGENKSTTAGTSTAATTSTTPRTTTLTSEAPATNTSAVPTVSAAPTSTTSPQATKTATTTSAAPAVVNPDDPGPLSPTARLEDVGIVTAGGEDFVVVTPGDTVSTDAQQGVAALEIWLGGGDPGATWATFTSDDPAADGWRWAAVNQETGTVVYVR